MISILKYVFLGFGAVLIFVGIFFIFRQEFWSSQFFFCLSLIAFGISGILAYFLISGLETQERLENTVNRLRKQVFVATDHG